MVRLQRDGAAQSVEPGLQALVRHGVDQVDADVRNAHRTGEAEGSGRLRGVGLPLQDRQGARVESLEAEAQAIDPALEPGRDFRLIGAGRVRLERHLGVGGDIESGADERQQTRHQVRRQQARRAAS